MKSRATGMSCCTALDQTKPPAPVWRYDSKDTESRASVPWRAVTRRGSKRDFRLRRSNDATIVSLQTAQIESKLSSAQRLRLASACVIGFASSANYTNHAPMVPALVAQFGFSLAAAGLLTTGIFFTHGGMQIPGGYLADRFGPKPVLSIALAVVCLGNIALGFA